MQLEDLESMREIAPFVKILASKHATFAASASLNIDGDTFRKWENSLILLPVCTNQLKETI